MSLSHSYILSFHPDTKPLVFQNSKYLIVVLGCATRDDRIGPVLSEDELAHFSTIKSNWIRHLVGMYNVIIDDGLDIEVLGDAAGMASVYFSDTGVASTPTLLGPLERDAEIDRQYRLEGSDNWYSGSRTPFKGIRWLLANHCFEVRSRRITRFWPQVEQQGSDTVLPLVARIAESIECGIQNLLRDHQVIMSLTGGRDSRVNLACVHRIGVGMPAFTIMSRSLSTAEQVIVESLVKISGAQHQFVPFIAPPIDLLSRYDEMTAGLATGARRDIVGSCEPLGRGCVVHLNGNLGALFKRFYRPSGHPPSVHVSDLITEFVQRPPVIRDGLQEWLDSTPSLRPQTLCNLMYLEQRGGRWMGVGERASQLFFDSYAPFCSRKIFQILNDVPDQWQQNGQMLGQLVSEFSPRLASIPYHSGTSFVTRAIPKAVKVIAKRLLGRQ